MSELFDKQRGHDSAASAVGNVPAVLPIDDAVSGHLSPLYWDWRAAFDHDSEASPLQHPDFVLAELATGRVASRLNAVVVREFSRRQESTFGVLVPKTIRTSQVGGIGPGWTLHGLRLAGGRFFGENTSPEQQGRLLKAATSHAAQTGAAFVQIEDLDEASLLYRAVQNHAAHGC